MAPNPSDNYYDDENVSADDVKKNQHLGRLRQWRNRKDRDLSLSFMTKDFKKEVSKPYEQLKVISKIWQETLPKNLLEETRLVTMQRGILNVEVSGSSELYELEQMLRNGLLEKLQNEMTRQRGGKLQRVKCKLGTNFR